MPPNRHNFCCDILWKSIIMALENLKISGNFFLLLCATLTSSLSGVCVMVAWCKRQREHLSEEDAEVENKGRKKIKCRIVSCLLSYSSQWLDYNR